jgi:hypothetical protein
MSSNNIRMMLEMLGKAAAEKEEEGQHERPHDPALQAWMQEIAAKKAEDDAKKEEDKKHERRHDPALQAWMQEMFRKGDAKKQEEKKHERPHDRAGGADA